MGCGTNIIPGFSEYDKQYKKDVRDPALEMKINSLFENRSSQVNAGVITKDESKMLLERDINAIAPNRKIKDKPHNFSGLESEVRNMPVGYDDSAGQATRKGDAVTEKLIKKLRQQEMMGIISVGDRQRALFKEIRKNEESFKNFLAKPKGIMGYG
tara:strand:+ start:49 stop:516 length:468 start_codon:yes stop_codon:yes gene_type:complete